MVLKFKSKLILKFMLKGSKAIKIMKIIKKRKGLTQVKIIFVAYKQTRKEMTKKKSTLKYFVSGCVVRSEHHNDIFNGKSIEKEHLTPSSLNHLPKRLFLFGIQ